jgi:molybdenum cofactor cytidylyltransferase
VTTAAVVLAAGGASRFAGDRHKLVSDFRGRPLVAWALDHALEAGLHATAVVTGAVDLLDLVPAGVCVVHNERWADGQASSLLAAVGWAREEGFDAIVVGLGDQPLVPPEAWATVAASTSPIAVAEYGGHRSPPTRLASAVWPLLSGTGDAGARSLMAERPDLVEQLACPGQAIDIDTLEDLARWS